MQPITVICSSCNESFEFKHPSVNTPVDLMHVTIDCPECKEELHAPDDALIMIPMREFLRRRYERMGFPQVGDMYMMDIETGKVRRMNQEDK